MQAPCSGLTWQRLDGFVRQRVRLQLMPQVDRSLLQPRASDQCRRMQSSSISSQGWYLIGATPWDRGVLLPSSQLMEQREALDMLIG